MLFRSVHFDSIAHILCPYCNGLRRVLYLRLSAHPFRVQKYGSKKALQVENSSVLTVCHTLSCASILGTPPSDTCHSCVHSNRILHPHLWVYHAQTPSKQLQTILEKGPLLGPNSSDKLSKSNSGYLYSESSLGGVSRY